MGQQSGQWPGNAGDCAGQGKGGYHFWKTGGMDLEPWKWQTADHAGCETETGAGVAGTHLWQQPEKSSHGGVFQQVWETVAEDCHAAGRADSKECRN